MATTTTTWTTTTEVTTTTTSAKLRVCKECKYYALDRNVAKTYYCDEKCRIADLAAGHEQVHGELKRKWEIAKQESLESWNDVE